MEEREEGVLESVEPVIVVVFENERGGFLARKKEKGLSFVAGDGVYGEWWRILRLMSGFLVGVFHFLGFTSL